MYDRFTSLAKTSFNLFHVEDTTVQRSGCTDYGDRNYEYIEFNILTNPLRIFEVKYAHYEGGFGCGSIDDNETTHDSNHHMLLTSADAFRLYGIGLFQQIANVEDWEVIIRSF